MELMGGGAVRNRGRYIAPGNDARSYSQLALRLPVETMKEVKMTRLDTTGGYEFPDEFGGRKFYAERAMVAWPGQPSMRSSPGPFGESRGSPRGLCRDLHGRGRSRQRERAVRHARLDHPRNIAHSRYGLTAMITAATAPAATLVSRRF